MSADEHGGPFWSSEGSLSGDYDDVHAAIGIPRSLYDDAMAWNDAALAPDADANEIFTRQQDLLRRLANEVGPEVEVPAARSTPPRVISLLGDDITAANLPEPLASEVIAWQTVADKYAHATGDNDADIWAWQDRGLVLAARVGAALGDDYVVRPF